MVPKEIPYLAVAPLGIELVALLYERGQRLTTALRDRNAQLAIDEGSALAHRMADLAGFEALHAALQDLVVSGIGSVQVVKRVQPLLADAQSHLRLRLSA